MPALPDDRFQPLFRMSNGGFYYIHSLIRDGPDFFNNSRSGNKAVGCSIAEVGVN